MQTEREAILALYRGERPDFIPEPCSVIKDVVFPGDRYFNPMEFDPYGTGPDAWGVMWTNQGPNPMLDGNTVAKGFRLFDDIEDWKKKVRFPDLDHMPVREALLGMAAGMKVDREKHVVSCLILSGAFELMNEMIGFENALCAFYESPDAVKEFLNAMCDYKLKCIELAHEYLKPDIIHMHDDWGTNSNMFFSPEMWREFIKPIEKRYVDRIHELGMLYQHHSCGYITQIIPDLIELGVDAIDPINVSNDVEFIMNNYADKITIIGALDNQLYCKPGVTPEQIADDIRKTMDAYVNKGRYLPYCVPQSETAFAVCCKTIGEYGSQIEIK